ncbi:MAG: hypothetical protein QXQ83_06355 [Archaeoglobaceae archaeon]
MDDIANFAARILPNREDLKDFQLRIVEVLLTLHEWGNLRNSTNVHSHCICNFCSDA